MIARRFQSFQRLAMGTAAVMGLYLITSQVASERTELERVDRKILAARKDIRQLQTELSTRANLRQLERWNGDVLALTTPDADQFISTERQLATLDRSGIVPGPRYAPTAVVMAMANVPTAPVAAKPAQVMSDAVDRPAQAVKRALAAEARAPVNLLPATMLAANDRKPPVVGRREKPASKPIDLLEGKLLDDGLVGELASRARVEGGGGRIP